MRRYSPSGCRQRTNTCTWLPGVVSCVGVVALLLSCVGPCVGQEDAYLTTDLALHRVLASMSAALRFMEEEVSHLNLDAVIGLRIVEGQLNVLLQHLASTGLPLPTDDILQEIQQVRTKAGTISDEATPYIQKGQEQYFNRIGFIIQPHFWEQDYPSRNADMSLANPPKVIGEAMHEADSDACLMELRTDRPEQEDCEVSTHCWNLMTRPGYRYYSLSHQIFYLQIGESTGCFDSTKAGIIEHLSSQFCASMLKETQAFSDNNYPSEKQDLFMEEAALCGIYGYRQFFTDTWLEEILGWQRHPRGCWGMNADDYKHMRTKRSERTKREERVLPDGCECHRTAVALGALAQYVRYITEYMQQLSGYEFF